METRPTAPFIVGEGPLKLMAAWSRGLPYGMA